MRSLLHRTTDLRGGWRAAKLVVIGGAVGLFLGGLGMTHAAPPDEPGQAPFEANCAVCHGADGSADTPVGSSLGAPDLRSDDVQKLSDEDITAVITNGKEAMPPFKNNLSAAQIKDVVAYVRTLAKNKKK